MKDGKSFTFDQGNMESNENKPYIPYSLDSLSASSYLRPPTGETVEQGTALTTTSRSSKIAFEHARFYEGIGGCFSCSCCLARTVAQRPSHGRSKVSQQYMRLPSSCQTWSRPQ